MIELAVIMDPIQTIKPQYDSTFELLLAAQKRNWTLQYIIPSQIYLEDGIVFASMQKIKVYDRKQNYFEFLDPLPIIRALHTCDITLLRKDPPFDISYLYLTYILDHAQKQNHLIINNPTSVRDANEKIFASWFPQCCPPTLVSSHLPTIKAFLNQYKKTIFKPLDSMGGHLIFLVEEDDLNQNVIIETLTQKGQRPLMAQQFIPDILTQGDKRILMINGTPFPHTLSRFPHDKDIRGNLSAGGTGRKSHLTERDQWICDQIGPTLKAKGLVLVGIDIIGSYLTEINVTSPMGIRQIEDLAENPLNLSDAILDSFIEQLSRTRT